MRIFDIRTGAEIQLGMKYPLMFGGSVEVLRVSSSWLGNPKVLVRREVGFNVQYTWLPAMCDAVSQACWITFPELDVQTIFVMMPYYHRRGRRAHHPGRLTYPSSRPRRPARRR